MRILGPVVQPLVSSMHRVGQQFSASRNVTGEPVRNHRAYCYASFACVVAVPVSDRCCTSCWSQLQELVYRHTTNDDPGCSLAISCCSFEASASQYLLDWLVGLTTFYSGAPQVGRTAGGV